MNSQVAIVVKPSGAHTLFCLRFWVGLSMLYAPAQAYCCECNRAIYDSEWGYVGSPPFQRWYRTLWQDADTAEGFTVRCHNRVLCAFLYAAEGEVRAA